MADEQSHYEVSLTAGQAFLAFVLLLLSLAASFAFGLLIGRGNGGEDKLVARKDAAIVTEAPKKEIAETAVRDDDFKPAADEIETPAVINEEAKAVPERPQVAAAAPSEKPKPAAVAPATAAVPHYAQLFSTADQKTAESLAAKLIDGGFTSAYVERGTTPKGPVFRVRVPFSSEPAARAAEPKLRTFSKDVWITKSQV
ncbi:MAG: SPOR domain-containing protein [Thermoanaerobaculia bacterium]|nr:SPOR domain-containing protein [Thermoanaerobaculia bacterium]